MDKIGKYEVLEEVGKGGFGVVFKGRDPFIRRLVAIKTCSSDSDEIRQRFFREAQIAGNLHHTNVVTIHDFGLEAETPFIVQEYIKGEDLDQKIKGRHPLTFEQKLHYLTGISKGLAYAHSKGVIHRDIKPSNIRITQEGLPKVMDFGIAKLSHVKSHLTQTGTTLGTVTYLAPEQLQGGKVDNRCDIFSFGVMAYELFAYRRPFDGESVSQVFYEILHGTPASLHEHVPACPDRLNSMVLKCLEKNPEARFPTFDAILMEIEEILEELDDDTLQVTTTRQILTPPTQVIDSDSHKQAELLAKMGGLPGEGPAPEDMQRLQRLAERAKAAVEAGDLTGAEVSIDLARRDHSDTIVYHQLFDPLLERLGEIKKEREADIHRQEEAAGLLSAARRAKSKGKLEEALTAARKCLELEPAPQEARELVVQLERELSEKRDREQRELALHQAVVQIESRLSGNDPEGAAELLEAARQELGEEPALAALAESIAAQRHALAVKVLTQQARTAFEGGESKEALDAARRALEMAPEDPSAAEILTRIEGAIEERRRQEERRLALEEQRGTIERLLEEGDLEQAATLFGVANKQFGEDPSFAPLAERIERARLDQQQAELRRRATDALDSGDLHGCDALLREAVASGDQSEQFTALQSRLDQAVEEQRSLERRETAMRKALAATEQALDKGDPEKASSLLEAARKKLGDDPRLQPLRLRSEQERKRLQLEAGVQEVTRRLEEGELEAGRAAIEEVRTLGDDPRLDELSVEIDQQQRARRADELLAAAREEISADRLERALDPLRQALALIPDHSAGDVLEETEAELAQRKAEERRRRSFEAAVAAIEADFTAGRLADADRGLAEARQSFGDEPVLDEIARRLETAKLEQRVADTLAEVDKAVAASDLDRARGIAQRALAELPDQPGIEARLAEVDRAIEERTERERQAEEKRKRKALADAVAGIEGAISSSQLDQAEKALTQARSELEASKEFDRLEQALIAARLEQHVAQSLSEIDRALAAGELERAKKLAAGADKKIAGRPEIEAKLAEVDRAIEERAERQRLAEEERKRKALDDAIAGIEGAIASSQLDQAEKALAQARGKLDPSPEFDRLDQELAAARLEQQVAQRLSEIDSALGAGELEQAKKLALAAGEEIAGRPEIEAKLAEVDRAIEERAERQRLAEEERKRKALEDAIAGIEGAIASSQLDQAEKTLAQARGELDPSPEFDRLDQELATARLEQHVAQSLSGIDRALGAGELEQAKKLALAAGEEIPGRPEIEAKLAEVDRALEERAERERIELERKKEAERLQRLTREASGRIQELLGKGDLAGAAKALAKARKSLGDEQALPELAEAVEAARRRSKAAEISVEATRLLESDKWSAALQKAEEALKLDPESKTASGVADKARAEVERERVELERKEQRARAAKEIEQLLGRGRASRARKLLDKTLKGYGSDDRLSALEPRLKDAEKLETEKAKSRRGMILGGVAAAAVLAAAIALLPRLFDEAPEPPATEADTPATAPGDADDRTLQTAPPPDHQPDDSPGGQRSPSPPPQMIASTAPEENDSTAESTRNAQPTSQRGPNAVETQPAEVPVEVAVVVPAENDPPIETRAEPEPEPADDRSQEQPAVEEASTNDAPTQTATAPAPEPAVSEREREQPATTPPVTTPRSSPTETDLPASEPAETERTTPAPVDETPQLRAALSQYEQAYEALNADAVIAINPTANKSDLERSFRNLRRLEMEIDPSSCTFQVTGDRATARCRVVRTMQARAGGRERSNTATELYEFGKSSGSWKILSWTISQ